MQAENKKEAKPSKTDWQRLYDAALKFRDIESWKWLEDGDLFGIQDPKSKEIGYCCVLGNLGQVYGLCAYLGTEGLLSWFKVANSDQSVYEEYFDAYMAQRCLMVSYENKSELDAADLKVAKEIGFTAKGRKAWPQFRSYRPGYVPWHLTKREASLLTLVLEQAREVALKLRQEPNLIMGPTDMHYLIRIPRNTKSGVEWSYEYREPDPLKREPIRYQPQQIDEVKIKRVKETARKADVSLEIDYGYMYAPVQEGDRPFYPYAILWVDHNTGFALHVAVAKPSQLEQEFAKELLEVFLKRALIPAQILVKKEDLFRMLIPYAERLGFEIVLVDELPLTEEAQRELGAHLLGE